MSKLHVMRINLKSVNMEKSKENKSNEKGVTSEKEAFLKFFQNDLNPRTKEEIKKNRSAAYNISL